MVNIRIYWEKKRKLRTFFVWWTESKYVEPVRSVKSINDMALWKKSTAYYDIIDFIRTINREVQGKKLSTKLNPYWIAHNLLHIFDDLNKIIDETPPTFGDWFEKMKSTSTELLKKALPVILHPALIEVSTYFIESFGNATRIEYGTGHELAFIMFLCAHNIYRMKPAGSHGVPSMDDDQYVSYI